MQFTTARGQLAALILCAAASQAAQAADPWRDGDPWNWEQHHWQPEQHPTICTR